MASHIKLPTQIEIIHRQIVKTNVIDCAKALRVVKRLCIEFCRGGEISEGFAPRSGKEK